MTSNPCADHPKFKLAYFSDNKGRNELIRLIFAVGKVPYEDDLVCASEYIRLRDSGALPWGQLPTLYVPSEGTDSGSEIFGQSCSIARFAAKKAKLYPQDDIEALRTDAIVDSWRDTLDLYYTTVFDRKIIGGRLQMIPHPPSSRHANLAAFVATELTQQFTRYERMLQPTGRCCRDEDAPFPCWADLAIYDLVKTMEGSLTPSQYSDLMYEKPTLTLLVEKIDDIDAVQSHLAKYPYNDTSHFFVKVSPFKRPFELLIMPALQLFIGLHTRVKAISNKSANEAAA